jgi:DNA-binding GntR family transcriptional regulator
VTDPRIHTTIASAVRARILDGTLAPGSAVSITYLSQEWDTSRQTAARALRLLADEGLLKRYPGPAGYRVTHRPDSEPN